MTVSVSGEGGRATRPHAPGIATCFATPPRGPATSIQAGWDSEVLLVADQVVRLPRRPEVQATARAEARLLPLLHASLPVEVPFPLEVCPEHGSMRYRRIDGTPADPQRLAPPAVDGVPRGASDGIAQVADRFAAFLSAVRAVPVADARDTGIPDLSGPAWKTHYLDVAGRFLEMVVPRLPAARRHAGERFLARVQDLPDEIAPVLVHGDLGPSHLLCDDGALRGVIDWGDACIGDPAIDLAWLLNATPRPFSVALRRALAVDDAEAERALFHHRLGPWYEVEHGLRIGAPEFVASGVAGVVDRLPT